MTLIELSTAIVLFTLLMGTAVPLLARLQHGIQHGRHAVADVQTWDRLARQFRRDGRASRQAPANPPAHPRTGQLATLQAGERVITWRQAPGAIHREASLAGKVVEREVYRFGDLLSAEVQWNPKQPLRLRLTLVRQALGLLPTAREAPGVPYSIEAQLAAD